MGVEDSTFKRGGIVFPITSDLTRTLLRDADPVLFFLIDFLGSVINTYVGPRFVAQAAQAGVILPDGSPVASAVAYAVPFDPEPFMLEEQLGFPLLAAYRTQGTSSDLAASYQHSVDTFEVVYALPPLTAGQAEQVQPVLHAVRQLIHDRVRKGWDPSYTPPGGVAGDIVWSASFAGLESIDVGNVEYGRLKASGNLWFPLILLELTVKERTQWQSVTKFGGSDNTFDLHSTDGTNISTIVATNTQQAPTLTSVSPATGPVSGGTAITLTGTLYKPSATVTIGGVACTSVVVVSATSITCATGAHTNPGAVDVVVTNTLDGQSATLTAGFTYT